MDGNNNNKAGNIVLVCALWIGFFVCLSKELLIDTYAFLGFILCVVATVTVLGVEYVNRKINDFFIAVKSGIHILLLIAITFLVSIQICDWLAIIFDILYKQRVASLIIFIILLFVGALLFHEWLSFELMLSSIALPLIRTCILNTGYSENNSADPIYLAIIILVFTNLFLNVGERKIKKWPIVVFVFNSIAFTRCFGYYESIVHYRTINYILVFIILLLLQCAVYYMLKAIRPEIIH